MLKRLIPLLFLAACGPMSLAEAERQCLDRARLAEKPRGQVSIGMSSTGKTAAGLELEVSGDYLAGRDPAQVFDSCVMNRTGQLPSRPLAQQPGYP
jgi:hypothetical protein